MRATGLIRFIFLSPVTLLLEFLRLQHPTSNHIPGRAKKIQICPGHSGATLLPELHFFLLLVCGS